MSRVSRAPAPVANAASSMPATANRDTDNEIEAMNEMVTDGAPQEKSEGAESGINLGVNPRIQARQCAPRMRK